MNIIFFEKNSLYLKSSNLKSEPKIGFDGVPDIFISPLKIPEKASCESKSSEIFNKSILSKSSLPFRFLFCAKSI